MKMFKLQSTISKFNERERKIEREIRKNRQKNEIKKLNKKFNISVVAWVLNVPCGGRAQPALGKGGRNLPWEGAGEGTPKKGARLAPTIELGCAPLKGDD